MVLEIIEFFERDIVEPIHYSLYRLDKQITSLVTMSTYSHQAVTTGSRRF